MASPSCRPDLWQSIRRRFNQIRNHSLRICETLEPEDCVIQSMPDVSPMRWHLAHTTWFFETFVLKPAGQPSHHPHFEVLFNSYYNSVGEQFPRHRRGLLSRPTLDEIVEYRSDVDGRINALLDHSDESLNDMTNVLQVGLHHEQQHQELMLTDIKHIFSCNPIDPVFRSGELGHQGPPSPNWVSFESGVFEIGHDGDGFAFDNESPKHRVFVEPFQLSSELVTNGEFAEFIEDGGYQRPELWLSLGWSELNERGWNSPLYWRPEGREFTLAGLKARDPYLPVAHLSFFEADAYARWADARLPTEAEWEIAASSQPVNGSTSESLMNQDLPVHPIPQRTDVDAPIRSLYGNVWQWTSSSYSPYPGYSPPPGAIGEYNGKFMCNQYVLRGSSCATSPGHARRTYRNFFPADARWQFTGLRLARDESGQHMSPQ